MTRLKINLFKGLGLFFMSVCFSSQGFASSAGSFDGLKIAGNDNGVPFIVTLNQDQTEGLFDDGKSQVVLYKDDNPVVKPRCLCTVYDDGSLFVAIEGNQTASVYYRQ